jgi:EAL domain-containing protein (putative c-di-GMP-specific phosphodiesterase class I)
MNLPVVAEGVETLHELELMRIAGCDRVQGHLYGMPLKAASAEQLLSTPDCSVPVLPELTIQAKSF